MPNIKQIKLPSGNSYDIKDANALHTEDLKSTTKSTLEAVDMGSDAGKQYAVGFDKNGDLSVNVPWANTTYTGANGVSLSGTTFSNSGVRDISTGTANGTISVNKNGTSSDVAVKGLKNAAYSDIANTYSATGTAPASGKAIKNAFDTIAPMIYQGTLGVGGTITDLPTASSSNKGFVYNVITAGTYGSKTAIVGDVFISNGSDWALVPSGDEPTGTVTSIATGVGLTGGTITTSGTIKTKLKSETASTLDSSAMGATASRQYAVGVDKSGYLSVNIPWTDTNTKVTSVGNHYAPTADANAELSVDASGGSTATWGSTNMVTGVNLQRDAKGHVVGVTVDSTKMPSNPNSDRYVNSAVFADDSANSSASPIKMTLTRAGSDSATITANIPKVSATSAGVAPKGASVSTQSQTTKFLREDGTWSVPSYTKDNNTTYTFANGTNGFTVTPSGGTAQTVTVTPNDTTKLPLAGGTLTGRVKFNNVVMPVSAGKVTSLAAGTTEIFKNGIAISNPTTANDIGWIRVLGTGEADTVLEIATGDDAGSTNPEEIVARQYNTSNAVVHEAKLLDKTGNAIFPKDLSVGGANGATLQYNTTTQSLDFVFA